MSTSTACFRAKTDNEECRRGEPRAIWVNPFGVWPATIKAIISKLIKWTSNTTRNALFMSMWLRGCVMPLAMMVWRHLLPRASPPGGTWSQ